MKNIKLGFIGLLALLTVLWWMAEPQFAVPYEFFKLRSAMVYLSGILGIGAMSAGLLLASRRKWLEPWLGGLDKMYRLHKWLGITGLLASLIHWLWAKGPKWAVGWGWLERPQRQQRAEPATGVMAWFSNQRDLAEQLGEWAFYALVALLLLALIKRFPYRWFYKTHRLLAVVYLLLVFHAVVLMKFSYWSVGLGPLMALLMMGGTAAALASLLSRLGAARRALGVIDELQHYPDTHVLKLGVQLGSHWPGHRAGQFAFVTCDPAEGAHPFTIASSWTGDGRMFFLIKELGDYTRKLSQTLQLGEPVTIEGPYGRFDFASSKPRHIWVAGGIGISPFIAKLQTLGLSPDEQQIDLFYSTQLPDADFIAKLRAAAVAAGVRLHLIAPPQGRLDTDKICQLVPDWASADVWFCGPAEFGRSLRKGFRNLGLGERDFHQELFELR